MIWQIVLAVFCGIILIMMAVALYFFIRLIQTLRQFLGAIQHILSTRDDQVKEILRNVASVTSDVKSTTKRIDETVRHVVSLPDLAAYVGKELLASIFRKEKR